MLRTSLFATALAAACLACAGTAAANTYCVSAPGCSGTSAADVQGGLDAATKHAGDDTVKIGPGTFTAGGLGFHYDDPAAGNHVAVVGAGPGKTTLTVTANDSATGLSLAQGSSVRDVHVSVPPGLFQHGLGLSGASAANVKVDGGPSVGVVLSGAASLRGSTVAGNVGIDVFGGGASVLNTTATGKAIGVRVFGTSTFTTLQRMRINASDGGGQPAAIGLQVECGRVALDDSVVYVRDALPEGVAVDASPGQCTVGTINATLVRQSTLLGAGADSEGVHAVSTDPQFASAVTVANSIVRGFDHPLDRQALGGIAFMETDNSNYPSAGTIDVTQSGGTGNLVETGRTEFDPGFVDEGAGTYRLAPGSKLIDAGTADGLVAGESPLDRAGKPRIVDGNGDAVARRDVGAFEFQPGA